MAAIIANMLAFWMICVQFLALLRPVPSNSYLRACRGGKASWELNIIFHSGWFEISKTSLMRRS